MPGRHISLGYRPALDGLRAVTVLAILAYHTGWIPGGWLGVDVFFTLSGFLITTLLLEEHTRTGTIAIGRFYIRRGLRLLPALVAFLIVWGGVGVAIMPRPLWPVIAGYLLGVLFYITNWLSIYWRAAGPFGHMWSLAIEEQFYLVWPVILLLLLRWVRRGPGLVAGLLTGAAVSLAWRGVLASGTGSSVRRIYAGTDTHADGLLIGAALAVWLASRGGVPGAWARAIGAGATLGGLGLLLAVPFTPGYAWGMTGLAAGATGGVLVDIMAGGSRVTRWLECAWLVRLGRISYGVCLWHFPIFIHLGVLRQVSVLTRPGFGHRVPPCASGVGAEARRSWEVCRELAASPGGLRCSI